MTNNQIATTQPEFKSYDLSNSTCTAVVEHDSKSLVVTLDGIASEPMTFTEYDEWGSFNIGEFTFDFHLLFDETLNVYVYGLEYVHEKLQTSVENERVVELTEIGECPEGKASNIVGSSHA